MRRLFKRLPVCALILATSLVDAAPVADYDALLQRARAGDHAPFLDAVGSAPGGERELNDFLAVAGWAGRQAEVIRVYEAPASKPVLRDYALIEVARAYRDGRRWNEALALFDEGARRFPAQEGFALGGARTLTDMDRLDEAGQRARAGSGRWPRSPDWHLVLAHVHQRQARPFAAVAAADKAYDLAPSRDDVALAYIAALQLARMAEPALRVASRHPRAVSADLMRRLEGDAVAEIARMADMPAPDETERFAVADQALARYDTLLARWQAETPRPEADIQRARIDRLTALHARFRMRDVVDAYETLLAEGISVPAYALSDVASAYLYLRQPERATGLYQAVLRSSVAAEDEGARVNGETGLYYALLESGRYAEASRVVRSMVERQPVWQSPRDGGAAVPSDLRLPVERLAALERLYSNDTRGAQQAIDELVEKAPNNAGLLTSQAQVLRARQQPRESERVLKLAETLEPRARAVELGQGFTALALQEWRQAELLRDDLVARYPEDLGTQRLDRDWQVHQMAELRVSGHAGLKNDNPVTGSRDRGLEAVLYSSPIREHWRAFAGAGQASSRFDEGTARLSWMRGGAQWRGRDLTVEGEASVNRYGFGTRPGLGLSAAYDLNDHWQVGGGLAHRARQTPLRALRNDIHANRVDTFVRWRADELREWRLSVSPSHFSDGNQRVEALLQGRERFYTAPRFWLDGLLDVSASRNSRDGAPYYNPRADTTVLPALRVTHVLHSRYETVWEQHLTVGVGRYAQRGFGGGGVEFWEYGQRFRTNDVFELGASISGLRRPYDGQRERDLRFAFDLTYRF